MEKRGEKCREKKFDEETVKKKNTRKTERKKNQGKKRKMQQKEHQKPNGYAAIDRKNRYQRSCWSVVRFSVKVENGEKNNRKEIKRNEIVRGKKLENS